MKLFPSIFCIIILFLPSHYWVSGQNIDAINPFPENNFISISVKEGLSQSTVYTILKDSKGFMWFGTRTGGLNKYNGYEFITFKNNSQNPHSLVSNEVITLYEDYNGIIWIGTRNGGLNYYDSSMETIHRIELPGYEGELFTATSIHQTNKDGIWIGTCKGLFYNNFNENKLSLILSPNQTGTISSITSFGKSAILIGSNEKIILYNFDTQKISESYFSTEKVSIAPGDKITPVMVDVNDNIWVGSAEGLVLFTPDHHESLIKRKPFQTIPAQLNTDIRTIVNDANGNIWFGTFGGLVKYSVTSNSFVIFNHDETNPLSLRHNSVYSMIIDETNTLWLGTWGGGVNMMSGLLRKFEHFAHQINNRGSLSDNIVSSFAEGKNVIWIGTEQGGLNFYNPETNIFSSIQKDINNKNGLVSNHIKALHLDNKDNLWIGTFGKGINKWNPETTYFHHYLKDQKVFSIAQTADDHFWIGTQNGLYKIDSKGSIIQHYLPNPTNNRSLSDDMVTAMLVDNDGNLWIGTKEGGICLYNPHSDDFKRFTHSANDSSTLSSNYIFSLYQGDNQSIWVGTLLGLNKLNKLNGQVMRVNESINMTDNVINGILKDENNHLWLSTNKGIIHYRPDEEYYTNYDFRDGLQSNEFNRGSFFKSKNGKLYFGGINGFNSFYPSEIEKNPYIPSMQFADLKLFYKSVIPNSPGSPLTKSISESKRITLSHSQSAFTIDYVALNYILPEKNQYAYYMKGYDPDWNYVGNTRSASYMNLGSGKYTFHVRASNNDNIWNEEGISLEIVVLPPFWRTSWAFLILGIILFLLLLLARAIIISRIKQQNMLEFQRREVTRIEEINNMKLRFFTDISHEFKTPLTLIASPVEKLKKYAPLDQEFGYLVNVASKNINRMMRLVEQLMTFRRIEKDTIKVSITENDLELFLSEIIYDFSELATNKQIKLRFHCQNINSRLQWIDRNFLDKIVFNLLSNAFKYTHKGGTISVFLTIENDVATIIVNDTGIGISQSKLEKIFERFYTTDTPDQISSSGTGIGLSLAKSLVELHHGSIEVESNEGTGSTFRVSIPVNKESYQPFEISEKAQVIYLEDTHQKIDEQEITIPSAKEPKSKDKIILIVEDNEDMREYLTFNFSEFNAINAENGVDAINIMQNIIPDIIITDLMMPKLNGIELVRAVKKNHVTSHIPVILLSAKNNVTDKIEGIETGADIYIEKPFDIDYLKVIVNNLLQQRKNLKALYTGNQLPYLVSDEIPAHHKKFLQKAVDIILANISIESYSVNELGDELGLSRSQLFRKFKTICDITPGEFIRNERLKHAAELLKTGEHNVNEIAYQSGFSSASYFITSFKKKFGKTPNEMMKQS